MKTVRIGLAALLMLVLPGMLTADAGASSWERIDFQDGIATYKQSMAGTDVCRFKGVAFIEAPMAVIGAVLADVEAYPQWVPQCLAAREIATAVPQNSVLYFQLDSPFPYKKRDMVVENRPEYHLDQGYVKIAFNVTDKVSVPVTDAFVRMPEMEGYYRFEYFGPEKTRMVYCYQVNPGGNVPLALANELEIKKYCHTNIAGMRRMVAKDKYIQAGLAASDQARIQEIVNGAGGLEKIVRSHAGQFIVDPALLEILAAEIRQPRYQAVAGKTGELSRVQQDLLRILAALVTSPAAGVYIQDKSLETFFSSEGIRYHHWLRNALAVEKSVVRDFLNNKNGLLGKALDSAAVVRTWVADPADADTILNSSAPGQIIAGDRTMTEKIFDYLAAEDNLAGIGRAVAERLSRPAG